MTSLLVAGGAAHPTCPGVAQTLTLRQWLDGNWAILFSRPEDYAPLGFELDRWLSYAAIEFARRRTRPLRLRRGPPLVYAGWITEVNRDDRVLALCASADSGPSEIADLAARALSVRIEAAGPRFAIVIDERLCCRCALSYDDPGQQSLDELLCVVDVLQASAEYVGQWTASDAPRARPAASGRRQ